MSTTSTHPSPPSVPQRARLSDSSDPHTSPDTGSRRALIPLSPRRSRVVSGRTRHGSPSQVEFEFERSAKRPRASQTLRLEICDEAFPNDPTATRRQWRKRWVREGLLEPAAILLMTVTAGLGWAAWEMELDASRDFVVASVRTPESFDHAGEMRAPDVFATAYAPERAPERAPRSAQSNQEGLPAWMIDPITETTPSPSPTRTQTSLPRTSGARPATEFDAAPLRRSSRR